MARLSLYLLGSPRLEVDGEPLEIGRRKAMALIAYLTVTGRAQGRDTLATLLWPESDQRGARANLRRTLSALNTALDEPWLDADRETIDLDRGADLWVDVEAFRRRLSAAREHGHPEDEVCPECLDSLAEAADMYRDDFMAGFTLRDSPEFDDWQFFQAESLRRELAEALERLVQAHCHRGKYEPAIDYARRWLRLDPLQETVHRRLMKLYAWTDQRPAALRQYQECVRILEEELGVSPSEETRALYERIQAGELDDEATRGGGEEVMRQGGNRALRPEVYVVPVVPLPRRPVPPSIPFVGREEELAQLKGCLGAALAGGGHVAFVSGEAGSGKTALVHEFARRAEESDPDLIIAIGDCNAYTGLGDPYLPFREILSLLVGEIQAKWARGTITEENARRLWAALPASLQALVEFGPDLIDSFVPAGVLAARAAALSTRGGGWIQRLEQLLDRRAPGDRSPDLAQSDIFEQYTHLLAALALRQPLLLIIDDAQWADAASIGLLFHLSRRLAGSRILLVVTYRPDEVSLGRGEARHPLEPVINELKRTYGDVWIDLNPAMERSFVDALLDTEPNRLGESFRAALYRQTEGHPLFTVELLRAMQERGDIVRDADGYWVEGPSLNWGALPARVEAVIEERIGRLDAGLREVLAVASVEGETFTAQVVARVQGLGERPVLGALSRELERRHHLVQAQGEVRVDGHFLSRYRFTHTMFQQYLYNTFGPGERRLLHGEIASVLEDLYQGENEEITVQLARHYAEAGRAERAVDYLLQAGDRARGLYALQEAIEFYQRALAFLKEQGAYARAARTLMKLGLTHHLAFDFPASRRAYQEGFTLWQRAGIDQAASGPPAPHPLRLIWFDPPTLDPTLSGDDTSGTLISQLFSGLVTLNPDSDVVPELAQTWEVLEGGSKYVFHLRDDARWSDGQPVTAEDFVYAWRRALDPAIGSPNASYLFDIKGGQDYYEGRISDPDRIGVWALDEVTLLVKLEGPASYFPQMLTQPALCPVPRHAVEAHGATWTELDRLVTNGPFRLESWQPGESMRLVRNPDYRGSVLGNVQAVNLSLEVSSQDQVTMYEADQLDIVVLYPSLEVNRARQRYAEEYFTGPALYTQYLAFNVRQPPFDDPRVRQALAMAIDKETLSGVTQSGFSFPAWGGFIPPEMPGHSPGIGLPYDPDRAQQLLAEAGYPGGRGFPAVGGLSNIPNKHLLAESVGASWREHLGIEVTWESMVWRELLARLDHDPPPVFGMGWRADYPDPDNQLRVGTHRNWTSWQDETYLDLVERARRITDQAERLRLYQQADRILVEAAALVPIVYGRHHLLVKPWVRKFSTLATTWLLWKDIVIEGH